MNAIISKEHRQAAGKLRTLLAKYQEVELLLRIGEYKRGNDKETDEAIDRINEINGFLRQGLQEKDTFEETLQKLRQCVGL